MQLKIYVALQIGISILLFSSCTDQKIKSGNVKQTKSSLVEQLYVETSIYKLADSSWAYKLDLNGRPFVKQEFVPAASGHQKIKTKEQAQKLAEIMKKKIYLGYDLPYLSFQELDSLQIDYEKP